MKESTPDIVAETMALRRELAALVRRPDWALLSRHDLLAGKAAPLLHDRLYRRIREGLAALRLLPPRLTHYPWRADLRHAPASVDAGVLLIWAVGIARHELRRACEGFVQRLVACTRFVPVLVTDVADFAHFSRLGWLVEYLPDLAGGTGSYQERKAACLAWRYRDALVVPASAGLASDSEWKMLSSTGGR